MSQPTERQDGREQRAAPRCRRPGRTRHGKRSPGQGCWFEPCVSKRASRRTTRDPSHLEEPITNEALVEAPCGRVPGTRVAPSFGQNAQLGEGARVGGAPHAYNASIRQAPWVDQRFYASGRLGTGTGKNSSCPDMLLIITHRRSHGVPLCARCCTLCALP